MITSAAFSPFVNDPGRTGSGRFSPLPTEQERGEEGCAEHGRRTPAVRYLKQERQQYPETLPLSQAL